MTFLTMIVAATALASQPNCPAQAMASANLRIVDTGGKPVADAEVRFTGAKWDSAVIQHSDVDGNVAILCVPPASGYDVTVLKPAFAAAHITTSAAESATAVRTIALAKPFGQAVRVTIGGAPVPGVTVRITDADGSSQTVETGESGEAPFARLRANGGASFEVVLPGFFAQKAQLQPDAKNGSITFELTVVPMGTYTIEKQ